MNSQKGQEKHLLTTIAGGGSDWVKIATLLLVGVTGSGTFFQSRETARLSVEEANRTAGEIHELYDRLGQAMDRQKELLERIEKIPKKLQANN
jgi:hypothetical protein